MLFIFFMITDPKTTTRTWGRQCAVAVVVAVVETLLRLYGGNVLAQADVHAPYYALFIVAPVTNLLEIWWDSRYGKKPAAAPASAAAACCPAPAAVVAPDAAGVSGPPR
jgi:hypothetical protein